MTLIYNKRTGTIKNVFSGMNQTIDVLFGDEAQDYKLIWDEIIVEDNWSVISNWTMFKINVETKQIELKNII